MNREAEDQSALPLEVVTAIVRMLRGAVAESSSASSGRLSLTEFRMLKRLTGRFQRARELAADLDISSATVSAAVENLVSRGYVWRQERGGDRRSVPLAVTAEGLVVFESARQRQHQALRALIEELQPAERRALMLALRGLARVLDLN